MTPASPDLHAHAAVTGVGSLPIGEPDRAVEFVAAHAPELPFWPQLPLRASAEGMLRQALGVDQGLLRPAGPGRLAVDAADAQALADQLLSRDPAITHAEAAGFAPFLRRLRRGGFPRARAVKGQVTGPLTLASCLVVDGRPVLDHPELLTAVVVRVAARAAWQARALADHGLPAVVVVDEPVLGMVRVDSPAEDPVTHVLAAIRDAGALAGVHSCATSQDHLWDLDADLVSLDLTARPLPAGVARRWAGGALLAAGLVPTAGRPDDLPAPDDVATAWLGLAAGAGDVADLVGRTVITATCGLAGVDEDAAAASFTRATAAGDRLRRLAGAAWAAGGAARTARTP